MKKRFFACAFWVLSLSSLCATTATTEPDLTSLTSHNLYEAFQDFVAYRDAHPEAFDATIQPVIAFAYELGQERYKQELAFQMLNSDEIDPRNFSEIDRETVRSIIRRSPFKDTVSVIESPVTKSWLVDMIYTVIPRNEDFLSVAKLAYSDDVATKRQGALALFELMSNDSTEITIKRFLAAYAMNLRDGDHKSFLGDEQLEAARQILTDAINDDGSYVADKIFFANALIVYAFVDERTEEQRRAILDILDILTQREDVSLQQRINITAAFVYSAHTSLVREEKRRESIALIIRESSRTRNFSVLNALYPFILDENNRSLTSQTQRDQLGTYLLGCMRNGRDYQKINVAQLLSFCTIFSLESNDVLATFNAKKEAAETCYALLSHSFLTSKEHFNLARNILYMFHKSAENCSAVATTEMKRAAAQRMVSLIKLPELSHWCRSDLVQNILNQTDEKQQRFASHEEISEAIECGVMLLTSGTLDEQTKFSLASSIFSAENPEPRILPDFPWVRTSPHPFATSAQLQLIIPILLSNLNAEYVSDYERDYLTQFILNRRIEDGIHNLATREQRLDALDYYITRMNNEERPIYTREEDAKLILDAKDECTEGRLRGFTGNGVILGDAPYLAKPEDLKRAVDLIMDYITNEKASGSQKWDRWLRSGICFHMKLLSEEQRAAIVTVRQNNNSE